jgi:taurine dioxygenase
MIGFLEKLWLQRKVIFFRDQSISPEQHIRFGRSFGALQRPHAMSDAEFPELFVFDRGKDAQFGDNHWHVDTQNSRRPTKGAIAILREAPEVGGDTLFADMTAAYEGLSSSMKKAVSDLHVVQSFTGTFRQYPQMDKSQTEEILAQFPDVIMPLVRIHPETGRKILYASRAYTLRIVELPPDESRQLLEFLFSRASIPECQCRFRWEKNSIAFWDNRSVQHYACFDYAGQRRRLERVSIYQADEWPDVQPVS